MTEPNFQPIDPHAFRRTMSGFATGVAVITTAWDGKLYGMTVNSLTSVSLDPCLLLFCSTRGSATGEAVLASGAFAINILGREQESLSKRFVGHVAKRFEGLDLHYGEGGMPLLPGALTHLCCRVFANHPGGDHDVIVGQVETCAELPGQPLVFHRGHYGTFAANASLDKRGQGGLQ